MISWIESHSDAGKMKDDKNFKDLMDKLKKLNKNSFEYSELLRLRSNLINGTWRVYEPEMDEEKKKKEQEKQKLEKERMKNIEQVCI